MTLVLLGIIPVQRVFSAEKIDWKGSEPKTGNRLAVLEFSSEGISATTPMQVEAGAFDRAIPDMQDPD